MRRSANSLVVIVTLLGVFSAFLPLLSNAQSAQCLSYPSNATAPTGYAASWDVFDAAKPLLVKTTCPTSGTSITLTVGKGDANQYVWSTAYTYRSAWVPVTLSGTRSGGWIEGSGTATLSAPATASASSPFYLVGYVCTNRGADGWKCGCANQSCTTSMWQIQAYKGIDGGGGDDDDDDDSWNASHPPLCFAADGEREIAVSTPAQLQAALAAASAGDRIIVASNTYPGTYTLNHSGADAMPIVVVAASGGSAPTFTGSFKLAGNHGVLSGLRFSGGSVTISGDANRLTRTTIANAPGTALTISGSKNRVDHNVVVAAGQESIQLLASAAAQYNRIDRNLIRDSLGSSENGHEGIQVGQSQAHTNLNLRTLIEANLLERIDRDGETISIKSSGNMIVGNTLVNSKGELVNRHGTRNIWKNNYIEDSIGMRIHGADHAVVGNLITGGNLRIMGGDVTQADFQARGGHPASYNVLVSGNTVANGSIFIGYNFSGQTLPAIGTTLEPNTGTMVMKNHVSTVTRATTSVDVGNAKRLASSDVGPNAFDPLCQD